MNYKLSKRIPNQAVHLTPRSMTALTRQVFGGAIDLNGYEQQTLTCLWRISKYQGKTITQTVVFLGAAFPIRESISSAVADFVE